MDNIEAMNDLGHEYEYYSLDVGRGVALLPDEHEVILNTTSGQMTLVDWKRRRFKAECVLGSRELLLIGKLLENWPSFTSYERLLMLISNDVGEQIVRIEDAREAGDTETLRTLIGPLPTILKACRDRLARFGIQIAEVDGYGYRLIQLAANRQEK